MLCAHSSLLAAGMLGCWDSPAPRYQIDMLFPSLGQALGISLSLVVSPNPWRADAPLPAMAH